VVCALSVFGTLWLDADSTRPRYCKAALPTREPTASVRACTKLWVTQQKDCPYAPRQGTRAIHVAPAQWPSGKRTRALPFQDGPEIGPDRIPSRLTSF